VNLTYRSRHLLPLAADQFRQRRPTRQVALKDLLRLDPEHAEVHLQRLLPGKADGTQLVLVNGNESAAWSEEMKWLEALREVGMGVTEVHPQGVGKLRPPLKVGGHEYADPLCGVEENVAYNAFLVGKSLLGMRVADVLKAVKQVHADAKPKRLILCGRRDAALVVCLAAAIEPTVHEVAVEDLMLSFWPLFEADAPAINAASILPGILRGYGDVARIVSAIAPRKILVSVATGKLGRPVPNLDQVDQRFTADPQVLLKWLK
jgi:hypothetical protein